MTDHDTFTKLLVAAQPALVHFVASLMPFHPGEVDDITQNTNAAVLAKISRYDPARPFQTWLFSFAKIEIRKWRAGNATSPLVFGEDALENAIAIAEQDSIYEANAERTESLLSRLAVCKAKLTRKQQSLLDMRYEKGLSCGEIAAWQGTNTHNIVAKLAYIRSKLSSCMRNLCKLSDREFESSFAERLANALDGSATLDEKSKLMEEFSQDEKKLRAALEQCGADGLLRKFPLPAQNTSVPRKRTKVSAAVAGCALLAVAGYFTLSQENAEDAISTKRVSRFNNQEENKMNIATIAAASSLALAAKGDVFSDVVHWWKFDRDTNGDGITQLDEVREVKYYSATTGGATSISKNGPENGGPVWTNMTVRLPMRGKNIENAYCLYFPSATNGSGTVTGQSNIRFSGGFVDSSNITFVARIFPQEPKNQLKSSDCILYNNNIGKWAPFSGESTVGIGNLVALQNKNNGTYRPRIWQGQADFAAQSLVMYTNNWYDVAWSCWTDETGKQNTRMFVAGNDGLASETIAGASSAHSKRWRLYGQSGDSWIGAEGTGLTGNKHFHGSIAQFAVWDRVLTEEEVAEAFLGGGQYVFAIGSQDASSGEFGTVENGSYNWDVSERWWEMAPAISSSHTELALNFMPPRWHERLSHIFHLVPAMENGSAKVQLTVNGTPFATQSVSAEKDGWWFIPSNTLVSAQNTIKLEWKGGEELAFDKLTLGGSSWQVGNGVGPILQKEGSGTPTVWWQGDWNDLGNSYGYRHVLRALMNSWPKMTRRFWLDEKTAATYEIDFLTVLKVMDYGKTFQYAFNLSVNGENKFNSESGEYLDDAKRKFNLHFQPGELKAGWNEITFEGYAPNGAGVNSEYQAWVEFIHHRLAVKDTPKGTVVILLGN